MFDPFRPLHGARSSPRDGRDFLEATGRVAILLATFLGIVLFDRPLAAQVDFSASRVHGLEFTPLTPGITDFDNDGHLDVAIPQVGSYNVAIFLGDGRGGLARQPDVTPLGSPHQPFHALPADFDGDGNDDLLISTITSRFRLPQLHLFSGLGDGSFVLHHRVALDSRALSLVQGDFDGDDHPDIAFSCADDPLVRVRLGDGTGFFPTEIVLSYPGPHVLFPDILAADVNGDTVSDLVLTLRRDSPPAIVTYVADGLGSFEPIRVSGLSEYGQQPLPGDWNADGHLDLAINQISGVRVHPGDGTGDFGIPPVPVGSPDDEALIAGDFDVDGNDDLLVLQDGGSMGTNDSIRLFLGDGMGSFSPGPGGGIEFGAFWRAPAGIATPDFDEDGLPDLVFPHRNRATLDEAFDRLQIHLASAPGQYDLPRGLAVPPDSDVTVLLAGDFFQGDGHQDLVAVSTASEGTEATLFAGQGDGTFLPLAPVPLTSSATAGQAVDINNDGFLDVLLVGQTVRSLLNEKGNGTFQVIGTQGAQITARSVATADFDEDGHLDLISTRVLENRIVLMCGNGSGAFPDRIELGISGVQPRSVATGDFDGDGHIDVAVAKRVDNGEVHLLFGRGDGTFFFGPTIPVGNVPDGIAAADLDRDGALDLAVSHFEGNDLYILMGQGDGSFVLEDVIPLAPAGPWSLGSIDLLALDLLGNGIPDLVSLNSRSDEVIVFEGNGDGTFRRRRFAAGRVPGWLAGADFDRDGAVDLAVASGNPAASPSEGHVSILMNRSLSTLNARTGNINDRTEQIQDVLFVNDDAGIGRSRVRRVDAFSELIVRAIAPASNPAGPAPFVVYAWVGEPTDASSRLLPLALGITAHPMPLNAPGPGEGPREIWKNIPGYAGRLGSATRSSSPAPSRLLRLPAGPGITGTFTLQGLMLDTMAPQGQAGVTNAVVVISE